MTINIKTIVDAYATQVDFSDYNIAADINNLQSALEALANMSVSQAAFANVETLAAAKTLTDDSPVIQMLNPNTADRDVNLPALAVTNHPFLVMNTNGSTYLLTVKNAGGTTIRVIPASKAYLFVSDGNQWFVVGFDVYKTLSPAQITANQNDYNPTGAYQADVLRINSDAARDITGLAGGSENRIKIIHNVGAFAITLKDESASSSAANRFALSADVVIAADQSVMLMYDATSSRWRMMGGTGASSSSGGKFTFGGYLTLESGVVNSATDQTAKTAVYWTPFNGDQVPLWDGSDFVPVTSAEQTLTLNDPNHVAGSRYDVFFFDDSGTKRIGTGPAWSSGTARGTGAGTTELETYKGVVVNKVSMTVRNGASTYTVAARYGTHLGTIEIKATGQTEDSLLNRLVSNRYNKQKKTLRVVDTTDTWAYDTATLRKWNNSAANRVTFVLTDDYPVYLLFGGLVYHTAGSSIRLGIGLDSDAQAAQLRAPNGSGTSLAIYDGRPGIGSHYLQLLEKGNGATSNFYGDNGGDDQSGADGYIWM